MGREESIAETRVCGKCRSKMAADRRTCPRCSAAEEWVSEAVEEAHSKRLALISGTLLALALIALGVVDLQQPVESEAAPGFKPADPLAARRAAAAAAAAAATEPESPADAAVQEEAYATGDGARLLEQYRQAVETRPEDADARTSFAMVLVRLKRTEEALPHFERAIALAPERLEHHLNLGNAFSQLRRWPEAIAVLRRGQQLQPADAATTLALAQALQRNGNGAEAVGEFQKAIGLAPNDGALRIALAETYEAQARWQEAVQVYSEYLKIAPAGADAEEARSRIVRLTGESAVPAAPGTGGGQ